ncbi:hypothetical protein KSC_087010 [Ktedonobacter sp. SOSP1-52]|uniref:GNAT family N-acetyltransferase n=1 Tax=Ktedonobacter sp. SOSP1-52 TaxID=2778366 RepID=UPI001915724D|nr:GNAT family N-acetyltransferase [Ktedonobacter sp. SOSP1-52]GHO69809.1 hypothetical protein KSC_087010 [Ktedonobacter sp. SOSP1-52]
MSEYLFMDVTDYTFVQLSEMHNSSFTDYFFPMHMTPQMLADFWRINHIDANHSVAMYSTEGEFVGLARLGVRGTRAWCGGFGIAPAFRGRGVSHLLAEQMVYVAREANFETLQLEVLTQNERAIKTYKRAGFVARRRLLGLEVATATLPEAESLHVERVPLETLLPWLSHDAELPCWGRELASLLALSTETIVAPGPGRGMNGLVIQRSHGVTRVQAAVLQSELTDAELASLLREAAGEHAKIQIYNEPASSALYARCLRLGFTELFSQHEMLVRL